MEAYIQVPEGTSLEFLSHLYDPDNFLLDTTFDDTDHYYYGCNTEELEEGEEDWFPYEDCAKMCGIIEGAIPASCCGIDGNGTWANGQMTLTEQYKKGYEQGLKLRAELTGEKQC